MLHVRFGSKTDFDPRPCHFRFTPNSGHSSLQLECPQSANSGHLTKLNSPFSSGGFCQLPSSAPGLGQ